MTWGRALAGWRFSSLLARASLAFVGLVVLALIGRSALAGDQRIADPTPVSIAATGPPPLVPDPDPPGDAGTASSPASVGAAHGRATPDDPVILNHASFDELRRLPGIGPKKAQSILVLRQRMGRFRQVEDLLRVKGIGRSTLKKLRPLVRLDLPGDASAA